MRALTLSLVLVLFAAMSFGQITKVELPQKELIGKIAPGGNIGLSIECYKFTDDTYVFRYLDQKFTKLTEWKYFTLKSTDDFNTLYSYFTDGFEKMPQENVVLNIGDGYLILKFSKFLGGKVVKIIHSTSMDELAVVGYTNQYTMKQIDKLFGKK